eukprot:scaffold299890_cov36-Tisochrysis_lutea.AAC.4
MNASGLTERGRTREREGPWTLGGRESPSPNRTASAALCTRAAGVEPLLGAASLVAGASLNTFSSILSASFDQKGLRASGAPRGASPEGRPGSRIVKYSYVGTSSFYPVKLSHVPRGLTESLRPHPQSLRFVSVRRSSFPPRRFLV